MQHQEITIERLQQRNKEFFKASTFFGDKYYKINHAERILTVRHEHGIAKYKISKSFNLTYTK